MPKYKKEHYQALAQFNLNTTDPNCVNEGYILGFCEKYYTLWKITQNGRHVRYTYRHNVTQDHEYAKELGLTIDENLHSRKSFTTYVKIEVPGEFKFGKYYHQNIADCEDAKYLRWYATTDDVENRELAIKRALELDPNWVWDEGAMQFISKQRIENVEYWRNRVKEGKDIKFDFNKVNVMGQMWVDGFWFQFPHKYYRETYYGPAYSLIINPETDKPMRTKGKGYKVIVYRAHLDPENTSVAIVDDYEIVKTK